MIRVLIQQGAVTLRHLGWKVVKGVGVLACQLVILNVEFFREVTCTAELQGIRV
jgi:hypothetical protein